MVSEEEVQALIDRAILKHEIRFMLAGLPTIVAFLYWVLSQ